MGGCDGGTDEVMVFSDIRRAVNGLLGPAHDGLARDGPASDGPANNGAAHDRAAHDGANHDGATQDQPVNGEAFDGHVIDRGGAEGGVVVGDTVAGRLRFAATRGGGFGEVWNRDAAPAATTAAPNTSRATTQARARDNPSRRRGIPR